MWIAFHWETVFPFKAIGVWTAPVTTQFFGEWLKAISDGFQPNIDILRDQWNVWIDLANDVIV